MNRKRLISFLMVAAVAGLIACNAGGESKPGDAEATTTENGSDAGDGKNAGSDPKGIGKFQNVELTHPLDEKMVVSGKNVFDVKCSSCHKLTDEKVVGPGWKGVTDRRTPEWIMNFVTNVDEMIEKDDTARKMMEDCLVRMPNQNLSDDDARAVLEYMRKNDGKN